MDRPQQQEIERSGRTPVDQESRDGLGSSTMPEPAGRTGRVPAANRQGHHPPREQDKPVWAGGAGSPRDGGLAGASKAELLREARRAGIRGRSRMTKSELAEALSSETRAGRR